MVCPGVNAPNYTSKGRGFDPDGEISEILLLYTVSLSSPLCAQFLLITGKVRVLVLFIGNVVGHSIIIDNAQWRSFGSKLVLRLILYRQTPPFSMRGTYRGPRLVVSDGMIGLMIDIMYK